MKSTLNNQFIVAAVLYAFAAPFAHAGGGSGDLCNKDNIDRGQVYGSYSGRNVISVREFRNKTGVTCLVEVAGPVSLGMANGKDPMNFDKMQVGKEFRIAPNKKVYVGSSNSANLTYVRGKTAWNGCVSHEDNGWETYGCYK